MKKLIDFNELKAAKEGRMTPRALIENLLERIDDVETIVFVLKDKDGVIKAGYSESQLTTILGLLETGKMDTINDMWEPV